MSILLSLQGVAKSFGLRPLFTDLTLNLQAGERLGLIGPNGSGKSTLLKLLAGIEEPDEGQRTQRRGLRLAYVPQDERFPLEQSVRQVLVAAAADHALEEHEQEHRAAIAWTQVGFADPEQATGTLSGGWRKRLALACALVRQPDFLLLDEPTNHLDLLGIVWLERLLRDLSCGYVVATHDRAFLRAVADDVVEVSRAYPGGTFRATGGYDAFTQRREEFLEAQLRQQATVANQVRRETEWLGRKAAARTRKASSRIEEALHRREELAELNRRSAAGGAAGIDFAATGRQTRKLLVAEGLAKSLGGKPLLAALEVELTPGTKLGLLGPNGSGKSTLLRLLAGETAADAGTIFRADGLRTVMFEQGRAGLDPELTLRRALSPLSDQVTHRGGTMHVAAWAKKFLFQPEQLELTIGRLSGGEQARVRIAQLMLQPADLLLLDEPTNDLDIPALEALEESLEEFSGAVVLVSHDRELMERLCTAVIGLDGRGGSESYASVGQWLTSLMERNDAARTKTARVGNAVLPGSGSREVTLAAPKPKKLTFKEKQEWDGMEEAIHAAEAAVVQRSAEVTAARTANHIALAEACRALEAAQATVERLYERWQELEEKRVPSRPGDPSAER